MTKGFAEHFKDREVKLKRSTTAILLVDFMNDFMKPEGKMYLEGGEVVIGPNQELIRIGRKYGLPIIHIKDWHRPNKKDLELEKRSDHCIEGSWGAEQIEDLPILEEDYVVYKRRYSGFYCTDLDLILRELGIETIIVTGVVTNICVRSTVHDGFFRGYEAIVPRDCVMATSEREQASTLWDIDTHFGHVLDLEDLIKVIESQED